MRLSLNWLSEFVTVAVTPEVLTERLTMAGFEVEAVETVAPDFAGVVVGRVKKVEPHPQADRLVVTEVEDGRRTYQVVCGATRRHGRRLYAFGPPGGRISRSRELKSVKLRGVMSRTLWTVWLFHGRTRFASFAATRARLADAGHVDV